MPTTSKDRYFWDSCVIIDVLQRTHGRIDVLEEYIGKAEKGSLEIVVSSFALVEVAKLPTLGMSPPEVERRILEFFARPYILRIAVDQRVAARAREIMRSINIKGKDAVHVASAALSGVVAMHTYDVPLINRTKGQVVDSRGMPLRVEMPQSLLPPAPLLDLVKS